LGYNKEGIKDKVIEKFNKFLATCEDQFNVKVVSEKASMAKELCVWCLAMKTFY